MHLLSIFPLALLFLIGGTIQIAGILSPTATNAICLVFMGLYIAKSNNKSTFLRTCLLMTLLAAWTLYVGLRNDNEPINYLVYTYYYLCVVTATSFGKALASQYPIQAHSERFNRLIVIFLLAQTVALLFQTMYGSTLAAIGGFEDIDTKYGTLFIQSDSTLALLLSILSATALSTNNLIRSKWQVVALATLGIYLTESKAIQAAYPVAIAIAYAANPSNALHRVVGATNVGKIALAIGITTVATITNPFHEAYTNSISEIDNNYYQKYIDGKGHRLAILGDIHHNQLIYVGDGLLNYANPLDKTWLFNAGNSLANNIYYDLGLIGLIITSITLIGAYLTQTRLIVQFLPIGVLATTYYAFNFGISDLATHIIICFALVATSRSTAYDRQFNQNRAV